MDSPTLPEHRLDVRPVRQRVFLFQEYTLQFAGGITSAFTLELAMILTSPAKLRIEPNSRTTATRGSTLWRLIIAFSNLRVFLALEVQAGLEDQRIGIGLEAMRVHLWVEPVRI